MARRRRGKRKAKKARAKKVRRGLSFRGPIRISYTPCRDMRGRFARMTSCRK